MKVMDFDACYDEKRYSLFWDDVRRSGSVKLESVYVRKDGCQFPVQMSINFVKEGEKEYVFNFIRDISERKQFEEALKKSKTFLNNVFASIQDGISVLDPGLNVMAVNPVMEKWYGSGIVGKKCFEVYHGRHSPCEKCPSVRAMLERATISDVVQDIRTWVEIYAFPVFNDTGDVIGVIEHVRDITERKRAEEALLESERRYRGIVEDQTELICLYDCEGTISFVNDAYCRYYGKRSEELVGHKFLPLIADEDRETVMAAISSLDRENPVVTIEQRARLPNGGIAWQEWKNRLIFDENGRQTGYQAVGRDITDRKRAEEALRQSEEKFRALAESARAGIILTRGDKFIYVNPETIKDMGYTKDELLSMNFWDTVHPDSRELVRSRGLDRLRGLETPSTYEIKVLTKSGETLWEELTSTVIDYMGGPAILATLFNITERKRAEEALRKSEANLERAQQIAAIGNWEWDLKTNMLSGSKEYYRMFGVEQMRPVPFERFASMVHPDDRSWVDAAARDVGSRNSPNSSEFRLVLPGSRIKYIQANYEIVKDEQGLPVKAFGTMQDITERKQIEEELGEAKQQAELYLDLMGHDINNMHQIALGYLEMAQGMPPDVQQNELIGKSIEVLQRSARLIKNVRKLQKLHDGVFQTDLVDVCQVLENVHREYGAVPGKTVTLNLNDCRHCQVRANDLLHDVFANLVGNAIKHTGDRAEIVIDLDVVTVDGRRYCRAMVEDDGPGIPDGFKGKIFYRLLKGTSKAKGMGLGLYLVKSLVDSYGGKVWVEDRVLGDHTKGARFVVILPSVEK